MIKRNPFKINEKNNIRHMVYRYHSSGSISWIWDFQLSSPLSSFGTTAWAALPDLYVNGSPKSNGIYRNQSTLHIYTNLCGTGSGTGVGGGEVGFCSEVNKAMNNEWGSATFNASDYSSSNRMITNTAYWNSSLGFVVFIR